MGRIYPAGDGGINRFRLLAGWILADRKKASSGNVAVQAPSFGFSVVDRFQVVSLIVSGLNHAVDFVGVKAGGETADETQAAVLEADWFIRFDLTAVVGVQNVGEAGAEFSSQRVQAGLRRPAMGGQESHRDLTDELHHGTYHAAILSACKSKSHRASWAELKLAISSAGFSKIMQTSWSPGMNRLRYVFLLLLAP